MPITTTPDAFDVRDELLRLAVGDPKGFCSLLYEAGLDLQGAVYRKRRLSLAITHISDQPQGPL